MAEYADNASMSSGQRPGRVDAAVIQNLEDAGCDRQTVELFIELEAAGEKQGQFRLLEKHRRELLDNIHKRQKQIDCLDYMLYYMKKEKRGK